MRTFVKIDYVSTVNVTSTLHVESASLPKAVSVPEKG